MRGAPGDKFELQTYGTFQIEGVPFEIQDPQEGRVANMIALQSANGRGPATLPSSTNLACSGNVSSIHLLGAAGSFGPPNTDLFQIEEVDTAMRCPFWNDLVIQQSFAIFREADIRNLAFPIGCLNRADGRQITRIPDSQFAFDIA